MKASSVKSHRIVILVVSIIIAIWVFSSAVASGAFNLRYFPLVIADWPLTPTPRPGALLISEVLADPAIDEPEGEWIEIYNPGDLGIALDGYMIGDAIYPGANEGMYRFPLGEMLEAGQVRVIANLGIIFEAAYGYPPDYELNESHPWVANMLPVTDYAAGATTLENSGDDIVALTLDQLPVDAVSWGSAIFAFYPAVERPPQGASLARRPPGQDSDTALDWVVQMTPDPGFVQYPTPTPSNTPLVTATETRTATVAPTHTATPLPLPPASILISEVLYDPVGAVDTDREWIELFNPGLADLPLSLVRIGDEESQGGGEGMLRFPAQTMLDSGVSVVIAGAGDVFHNEYGFYPDFEIQDSPADVPLMGRDTDWASGTVNLRDDGDELILMNADGLWIDAVSWGDSTIAFSPSVPAVTQGSSIERYPADSDTDSAADWRELAHPAPGVVNLTTPTPSPIPSYTPTPSPTPTPTATPTPTPVALLVINEIHADPDTVLGDANGDGTVSNFSDEFLEIVNASGASIDLSGWTIWDTILSRHTFPSATILPDGCAILVFGGGDPVGDFGGALVQTASSGGLYLNDLGEIVSLRDPGGDVHSTYTYGIEASQNQSITRDPDVNGPDPLVPHSQAAGSGGSLYSPGTRIDGSQFLGCTISAQ